MMRDRKEIEKALKDVFGGEEIIIELLLDIRQILANKNKVKALKITK